MSMLIGMPIVYFKTYHACRVYREQVNKIVPDLAVSLYKKAIPVTYQPAIYRQLV